MSLHLEDVLFDVQSVMGPEFPVSFGTTERLITMDLVILVFVERIVPDFCGTCSLLHMDAVINKPCKLPNHANHRHKLLFRIFA